MATTSTAEAEDALLQLLDGAGGRGKSLNAAQREQVDVLAQSLEQMTPSSDTNDSPLLPGRWRVLYQGAPGTETRFFSATSWKRYLSGDGPSPIQNLVAGSGAVDRLYQVLEPDRINNVVDFSDAEPIAGVVAIEARLEGKPAASRLQFRFSGGSVLVRAIWNGTLALPYPVPFELLGENAVGWLQTDYISPRLRLSRGNKGTLFVLAPEPLPNDSTLEALLAPAAPPPPAAAELPNEPIIICPAQFGTTADYADLLAQLQAAGHPALVAPLKRTDWFRLIPASLTAEYWRGELRPETALPFYFEALDAAVEATRASHPGQKISLVGHSIGGWIARAYLGQLPAERRCLIGRLVTLGTPHIPPPEGLFRALDQTRGLLTNVQSNFPGAFHPEIKYLCVGSRAVKGELRGGGLDGLLGAFSYLPLSGKAANVGDGITPYECAILPGADELEVDAFHIGFVPFAGFRLLGTTWYGSPGVAEQWIDFLSS